MDDEVAVSSNSGSAPVQQGRVVWDHDMGSDDSLSTSVVFALAAAEERDALELDRPLSDALDPDALDALFTPVDDGDTAEVSFQYRGADVTVRSNGVIEIDRTEP